MKRGDLVKIHDIGQLAMFIRRIGHEVELELCGETFWLPDSLVERVGVA